MGLIFHGNRLKTLLSWPYKSHTEHKQIDVSCWHELPRDIMEMLLQRLNQFDRVRMSMVCKSWRSFVMEKEDNRAPQLPWLLLPHASNCKSLSFYDLSEQGGVHDLKLPKPAYGGYCCGSSKGWLIFARQTGYQDSEFFILNPITGARHQLPSLTTIPSFHEIVNHFSDPCNVSCFVNKIVLSSSDPLHCTVAAIFDDGHILAFSKVGGDSWSTFIQGEDKRQKLEITEEKNYFYRDILFSSDMTFYVLKLFIKRTGNDEEAERVAACTFMSSSIPNYQVSLKFIPYCHDIEDDQEAGYADFDDYLENYFLVDRGSLYALHLVESSEGGLLLIKQIIDLFKSVFSYDDDYGDEGEGEGEGDGDGDGDDVEADNLLEYQRTSKFEIYQVDTNIGSSCQKERLRSLGDQILFLSRCNSSLVQARDLSSGFDRGNCIYFLEEELYFKEHHQCSEYEYVEFYPLVSRESGVFYLDEERIQRCFPSFELPLESRMAWFFHNHWK